MKEAAAARVMTTTDQWLASRAKSEPGVQRRYSVLYRRFVVLRSVHLDRVAQQLGPLVHCELKVLRLDWLDPSGWTRLDAGQRGMF